MEMSRTFLCLRRHLLVLRQGTQTWMVHKAHNCSECNPMLPCHLWWEKKRTTTQASLGGFFRRIDRTESSKQPELCHQCCAWVKLLTVLQLCYLPPLLPPTVSNSSCQCPWCQPLFVSCLFSAMYLSRCCIIR